MFGDVMQAFHPGVAFQFGESHGQRKVDVIGADA
jgi:hypothetical protein